MRVFGVIYASLFDEDNVFLHEGDALLFVEFLREKHKLSVDDAMLRIIPIEVQETYDVSRYMVVAPKPEVEKKEAEK